MISSTCLLVKNHPTALVVEPLISAKFDTVLKYIRSAPLHSIVWLGTCYEYCKSGTLWGLQHGCLICLTLELLLSCTVFHYQLPERFCNDAKKEKELILRSCYEMSNDVSNTDIETHCRASAEGEMQK